MNINIKLDEKMVRGSALSRHMPTIKRSVLSYSALRVGPGQLLCYSLGLGVESTHAEHKIVRADSLRVEATA